MANPLRFLELVFVTWVDSETEQGWGHYEDSAFKENTSVGYLIYQDMTKYVLAGDYDPETGHFNRILRVPKDSVRKLRVVTVLPLSRLRE